MKPNCVIFVEASTTGAGEGVEAVNEFCARGQWIEMAESNQGVIGSIIVSHSSASCAMTLATRLAADAEISVSR